MEAASSSSLTVEGMRRHQRNVWWTVYFGCLGLAALMGLIAVATTPRPFSLALLVLLVGACIVVVKPVAGIYLTVFLAIVGDGQTSPWYPFTKGFSSPESILYVSRSLIANPLELYLLMLVIGWSITLVGRRPITLIGGRLMRPLLVFTGFMVLGFMYGMAKGGNRTAALWEIRPILYLPVVYFLLMNIFTEKRQYERLYWVIMVATSINGVIALIYRSTLSKATLSGLESLVQHGAILPMNALFMLIIGTWLFRGASRVKRIVLPLLAIPVLVTYILSQRRSAIVALVAAMLLLFAVLFKTRRKLFWLVAPTLVVLGAGYTAAFWNSHGGFGYPAQAIKSVISPNSVSARDQSSDVYRIYETADILATIHSRPLTGVGFGNAFFRPIPLPPITSFLLDHYITHNCILWIWLKAGVFGFISMLYLLGTTIRTGARAVLGVTDSDEAALSFTSVSFVVMYAVFSYVDISWDAKSIVFLAVAMAQIARTDRALEPERPTLQSPARVGTFSLAG